MRKRKSRRRKLNQGGLAIGPKHSRGGIPGIIKPTGQPIEFEGGEYIMRASSVKKYGEGAMARINQGLANVSAVKSLKKGGLVKSKKKFARGGMFDPYADIALGGPCPCDCTDYGSTGTCTGTWSHGGCECYACCNLSKTTSPRAAKKGGSVRSKKFQRGGGMSSRRNASCPDGWEHSMPNGTWMCGRTHGGQMRRHGGSIKKRMSRGGSMRARKMQLGGRTNRTRKMQSGGIASAANMNYSQLSKKA